VYIYHFFCNRRQTYSAPPQSLTFADGHVSFVQVQEDSRETDSYAWVYFKTIPTGWEKYFEEDEPAGGG